MIAFETDWLKKWGQYTPGRMALREHARAIEWSYFEMNQRVNCLANYLLQELTLKRGDRIAVYSKNRAEYVFLFFACAKSGVVLVPLNFRLMPRELDHLIHDAEPQLFLYEAENAAMVQKLQTLAAIPKKMEFESLTPFLTDPVHDRDCRPERPITGDDLVMILYTAGTTGLSKGAMISHSMLYWNAINTHLRLDITSADHTQSFSPFFHTGGWNVLLTPFFLHGASHTLLDRFDADLILKLMESEKTTLLFGVPTMMQMMADSPLFDKVDLSTVRYAIVGGAPMPIPLINKWHAKGIYIRQGYGLTEVGPNCYSLHQDDAVRKRGSIGFPNFYFEAKVMDENGGELGSEQIGELWLKSPVVTPGYWRNEEATRQSITDGWFHTGDMVRRDAEGYYYVVDRKKNMFISGAENVYPAEVETFLYTNEAIKEVAVIGVPDEKWGEVGKAFVVLKPGFSITAEEIIIFCKGELAKYKIPKYVQLLDELPKNEAGKINLMALKEQALG
jgi:fatty-acyl-CoA synthase